MASIIQVNSKWRAQVRRKGHKTLTKTFLHKREAEAWARRVETGIDERRPELVGEDMTVAALIEHYRRLRAELGRPVAPVSNSHYMLEHLSDDLGDELVRKLTPQRLAQWAKMRQEQGAGGYTVNMELSALGTAIRHTASFLQITLPDVVGAARPLMHYAQLITGGTKRTRRPNEDELARLLPWLAERSAVVADAVRVSAITGMRRSELARIAWADIDELRKAVLVRMRKHPRRIEARDDWVPLLGDAWAIVQRQPKIEVRIFPVSPEKLTDLVTAGVRALGIPNLHLHDMRRHANSSLREMGFDDDARQAILGHSSREMNSRYVAVSVESLHEQYAAAQDGQPRRQRQRKAGARQT